MVVRLYLDQELSEGRSVDLTRDQSHYLFAVMRLGLGDRLRLFDGCHGEWEAEVEDVGKRAGRLKVLNQTAPQRDPPDLWLLFAPLKKARTDFLVEKAAEMGAARILPVQTARTNTERIRRDRLQAHAVEAAEQCGATHVAKVGELRRLDDMLDNWPDARRILFCDEALAGGGHTLPDLPRGLPWAILIGPEGGFTEAERGRLAGTQGAHAISLGPRILRADTAAVAALTLWQSRLGEW